MKATLVKLKPVGSRKFHFGYRSLEINDNIFHSDSLFSTICNNYIRLYGEEGINEFIKKFPKISSVFFGYERDGKRILFVQRPLGMKLPDSLIEMNNDRKLSKKVKFISMELLGSGTPTETPIVNKRKNCVYSEMRDENLNLFYDIVDEKVAINRATGAPAEGQLYVVSSIMPTENTFLYFLVMEPDERTKECINAIEKFGIGGEITSGYGQVEVKIEENAVEISDSGNKLTNLSLVFPKEGETSKAEKWELIERRGHFYGTSSLRKTCIGIKEGSVFSNKIKDDNIGDNINVSSGGKKAFRYGKAFLIPFHGDSDGK